MYIQRQLLQPLQAALKQFPAVLVTGPRQSGKTTFLQEEFGDQYAYLTFDDPLTREFATTDPNGFLAQATPRPLILDEIQYVPELLPYLKMRIDKARRVAGQWLLTGSQQFALMKNVSESLAGRIALLELLPLSLMEQPRVNMLLEEWLWSGGYPEPALYPDHRDLWMSSYIQTYIERDIRLLQNVQDLRTFEMFLALCAGSHGQIFNKARLARTCGISEPTLKTWGSLLEASYIVFFLPPYYKNYGKRLTKTPKLYFLDSGLVCTLTRQPSGPAALAGAMAGAFFEGVVVSEAVKVFTIAGKRPDLFFWRSHDGLEVDLIIQIGARFLPVEIKLTATPTLKHLEPLNRFRQLAGTDAADVGILVCGAEQQAVLPNNNLVLPWREFPRWLQGQLLAASLP
jgi:predicted AAA+ superfamily ATPase